MIRRQTTSFYLFLMAVGLAALTAACASADQPPPMESPTDVEAVRFTEVDELRVTSRIDFVVCVDGAGGRTLPAGDVERIELELEAALTTVSDLPTVLQNPIVTDECPPTRPGLLEGEISPSDMMTKAPFVNTPSAEVLWVYMIPRAGYEALFGQGQPAYLIGVGEYLCSDNEECQPVTTALYLNDAIDAELLREVLLAGLNQKQVEPRATPFEWADLQACDRGETPTYFRCDELEGYRQDLERELTPQPLD